MKNFRITKYNPEKRNAEGHYLVDEWTCPSEVGTTFDDLKFEEAEYFEIESKYISSVVKLLKSKFINRLRVVNFNSNYMAEYLTDIDNIWLLDNRFTEIELFEDKSVNLSQIEIIIKMILRNFMSCSLEIDGEFSLHFGYDFYMYINTSDLNTYVLDEIRDIGLFIEELDPVIDNPKYQFSITSGAKDQEFVEDEVILTNMSRDKIRIGLGYSVEHPCNHSFKITSNNCSIFTDQFEFDFDNNEYFLTCEKE